MNIDFSETIKNIERLKQINLDDSDSYKKVNNLIEKTIIPHNIITLRKGQYLFRARPNEKDIKFTTKEQLTYRKDIADIKKYGRANELHQSIFYGAHKTETALLETSSLFKDENISLGVEKITLGRWFIYQDIQLLGIISNKDAMIINPTIKELYLKSITHSYSNNSSQYILEFFSHEFSKNVKDNSNQYKISCSYFNYILKKLKEDKIFGVAYPSVQNEFKDMNVALIPEAVEKYMILDMVGEYEVNTRTRNINQIGLADIKSYKQQKIEIKANT